MRLFLCCRALGGVLHGGDVAVRTWAEAKTGKVSGACGKFGMESSEVKNIVCCLRRVTDQNELRKV